MCVCVCLWAMCLIQIYSILFYYKCLNTGCRGLLQHGSRRCTEVCSDRLQWVLNAAAHLVSGMCKYNQGLVKLLHVVLHWLDVAEWVR